MFPFILSILYLYEMHYLQINNSSKAEQILKEGYLCFVWNLRKLKKSEKEKWGKNKLKIKRKLYYSQF